MKTIVIPARVEELDRVNAFIQEKLEACGCSMEVQTQVALAAEEIFVNIAHYAYHPEDGEAEISADISGAEPVVTIRFLDRGKPFNPLDKPDADTGLSPGERNLGGLGILLVKKSMDAVTYSHEDGKNILTIQKKL